MQSGLQFKRYFSSRSLCDCARLDLWLVSTGTPALPDSPSGCCCPSHAPFPKVAWCTFGAVATTNAIFGGLCVALFNDVEGNVIDSLPQGSAVLTVVRSLLVVDLHV